MLPLVRRLPMPREGCRNLAAMHNQATYIGWRQNKDEDGPAAATTSFGSSGP
jgi:hypothetical protein